jgi:hypothetical protein
MSQESVSLGIGKGRRRVPGLAGRGTAAFMAENQQFDTIPAFVRYLRKGRWADGDASDEDKGSE